MRRRRIPRTGELVPCVGLGTSRTLDVDPDGGAPRQLTDAEGRDDRPDWAGR